MVLKNCFCFIDGKLIRTDVRCENGIIAELGEFGEGGVDLRGGILSPGFVDVHTHGCAGYDFSTADEDGVHEMLRRYFSCGVPFVMPTLVTMSYDDIRRAVTLLDSVKPESNEAGIIGIRLEGPFLSKEKCGAHDKSLLRLPDAQFVSSLPKSVRVVDAAPELQGFENLVKNFGGRVSIAHTACDYETAVNAVKLGANRFTHLFNAMNPMLSRAPGCVGAFADTDSYAELICDTVHVHPSVLRLMFDSHSDRIAIISDSMAAEGLPGGRYKLGNLDVTVSGGEARLTDGTLAGSAVSISEAAKRLRRIGVSEEKILRSLTCIPSESVGLENLCGYIRPGAKAVFTLCDFSFERCASFYA